MIEKIDLSENSINDTKFKIICPGLVAQKRLKDLNLSKNQISNQSFEYFLNLIKLEYSNGYDLNLLSN